MFGDLYEKYEHLVFFDTETTGLMPDKNDQIIELAAISVDREGCESEMDRFIRLTTREDIPPKVQELTDIIPLTLSAEGIDEKDAIREFWSIAGMKNTLLIAHNAHFDLSFLVRAQLRYREELPEEWQAFIEADYLDTLTIYRDRKLYPHKLENAIVTYGLSGKVENTHRAVDDCRALFEVTKRMWDEKADLEKYINLFGFLKKWGPEEHPFKKVTYGPQDFDNLKNKPLYERV